MTTMSPAVRTAHATDHAMGARRVRGTALAAALLLSVAMPVGASSFAGTSAGTSAGGTSASSGSTSGDDKVVLAAREDAAGFVATDGALRTVRLEAALRHVRAQDPAAVAMSDLALAQAILAR